MTLTITNVHSYRTRGSHKEFIVDATLHDVDHTNISHIVPSDDATADAVCTAWLDDGNSTATPERTLTDEHKALLRREERVTAFANTIDKMNPVWWGELTSAEQLTVKAYRKAWLDWPTSDATTFPTTYDVDDDNTGISTDVSDIFT